MHKQIKKQQATQTLTNGNNKNKQTQKIHKQNK